ncbi:tRNA(Met) cytidine acetyltransferase TmcA [Pluralibacter gergoviae]|uniref:tRNA(Met) cytidine acetyltransferase TmcA n=2 Tax=Pluralibacter gergoviae TaxID=61647 RepID=A0AAW8HYG9_PLUGE|nr:GNAT family N-acetyltransferase [Pluralibacter gergoviae]AVR05376.1 tRNA(Met) cytidine acetyltransferase [Pluralibacter gergoviae]KMK01436.1 methionine tRNA cytidine acetyltransferase [Pluralibacter gergoviae]KMK21708.1 methionine tRNA cytidine acetyltransferase [Pluralibacter gergoviae]MDQ2312535.1 GNAT family N-acetyltransferase [Pluralibacter gergoviae]SUB70138.1 tRNA(Met) cytidine acetyltransferase TmcA [Pluralibacter gergoviae]
MSETDAAVALATAMAAAGIRRLLVLSGDAPWCLRQARRLREQLGGDGLWVGPDSAPEPSCAPGALARLLGREYHHAFFDALSGFDASAFAALAGTLKPGSWLVLLAPPLAQWPAQPDADSLRWNDAAEPIPTPHFIHHFCRIALADPDAVIWQQGAPLALPDWPARPAWQPASGAPLAEQAAILDALAQMPPGAAVVTAGRGRGKSALAGMHLRALRGTAIVTAPAKGATDVLAAFAGERFHFMAPDALLAADARADWLIVDEAAAIPGPLLAALVSRFPRALLTTTVQGYEGTGRGFLLKVCARFSSLRTFTLEAPVRWASGCPLEALVARALLFDDAVPDAPGGAARVVPVAQSTWRSAPGLPTAMYRLLSAAHYRTSPLDLRRMMDADGQRFTCALRGEATLGALWLVDEGGLSPALSRAVWAGFRRPRGNLVAQSLAAHGGSPLAATLGGRRISRIAVHPQRQGEGIGRQMVADALNRAEGLDYLSVSFGYTDELLRFWQRCGFTLVRVGTHREASSGCYSAIALLPLSEAGRALAVRERERMRRDAPWLDAWRSLQLAEDTPQEAMLTDDDWPELASFAWAHRPLLAAVGSLNRLALASGLPLRLLRATLARQPEAALVQAHGLSGRKALLAALRAEAASALAALDGGRARALAEQVENCNFFN